jgi:hypothetical protein
MVGWILIAVLYLVGIGLFRFVGGVGSAGEAFQRWGRASSILRSNSGSSS